MTGIPTTLTTALPTTGVPGPPVSAAQAMDKVINLKKALRLALDVAGQLGSNLEAERQAQEAVKVIVKALSDSVVELSRASY